jgi:hypothetical protein
MIPKPRHLQPPYGAQFQDETVVAAYQYRPEYPAKLFDIVARLISDEPRRVLDVGCGTGYQETAPVAFSQSLDHYLESWHARNGLSRQRMGEQAAAFDQEVCQLLLQYGSSGRIESEIVGHVTWGKPLNPNKLGE